MVRKTMAMMMVLALGLIFMTGSAVAKENTGVDTANGWYEGEEIYYQALGVEEGVTQKGENQIYLIGGDRLHQAQVVLHVPGEPGYSPHWNVNVVHTAEGVTVQDIVDAGYASTSGIFNGGSDPVLFDDVEDILAAEADGLVTIVQPGVVVLCPIVSEQAAEAPGHTELGIAQPFTEASLDGGF